MASFTKDGYRPKPGDTVKAKYGKHIIEGVVLSHPKNPRKPWVFSTFGGAVLCKVKSSVTEKERACNELELVKEAPPSK